MLEMALAAVLVSLAIFAIGGKTSPASQSQRTTVLPHTDDVSDLPCPWCQAQTTESDAHCPSCGQRFG